jgi:hypothetical protein
LNIQSSRFRIQPLLAPVENATKISNLFVSSTAVAPKIEQAMKYPTF